MPPPTGASIGGGELTINVKGHDQIRGRSGDGSGGGEKDKGLASEDKMRASDKIREEGRVGGRASSRRGAGGGGQLNITVKGLDLIRGRSANGTGGGEKNKDLGLVQGGGHVGPHMDKLGEAERVGGRPSSSHGGDGGDPTDGTRGGGHSGNKGGVLADARVLIASSSPSRNQVPCLNQIDAGPRTNFTTARVQRTLCFDETEEAMFLRNHQLFLCRADTSPCTTLTVYVQAMIQTLVSRIHTPGSFPRHTSCTTNPEIKAAIKEIYVLIKCLNRAGYSLCGQFTTDNFVIDKVKGQINIRFSGLHTEAFKKSNPDNDNLDILGFKKMVRRQIFKSMIVPHDVNLWLSMIGKEECQQLMPHHIYLLDYKDWTDPFMKWYDTWQNLKDIDSKKYSQILEDLEEYRGWKAVVQGQEKNSFLEDTLTFVDPHTHKEVDYPDSADGLIHLLRNCRHHQAIKFLESFSLIACQFFPNLISDFQLAMVKAGCIKLPA